MWSARAWWVPWKGQGDASTPWAQPVDVRQVKGFALEGVGGGNISNLGWCNHYALWISCRHLDTFQWKVSVFLCPELWERALKYKHLPEGKKKVALWTAKPVLLSFFSPFLYHNHPLFPISSLHLHRWDNRILVVAEVLGQLGSAGFALGEVMLISLAFLLMSTSFHRCLEKVIIESSSPPLPPIKCH